MDLRLPFLNSAPMVAVIRLQGVILSGGRGLDDATLGPVIDRAFARGKPAAVALEINSPGGSPVQSSLIAARIRRLAEEKRLPVIAFVEDVARLEGLLDDIHREFIDHVKTRRGSRLSDNPDLFTGEIWIGEKAVSEGLADGVGHLMPVLKERFGQKVRLRRHGTRRSLWRRLGARLSAGLAEGLLDAAEERALLARYGL
jgi:ClpP class serine protease